MTAGCSDHGPVRIRRRGRHTTPSQVEKVALQAGKAAPAVAIAGALVAAPQPAHAPAAAKPAPAATQHHQTAALQTSADAEMRPAVAAVSSPVTRTVTVASAKPARHAATVQNTYYTVRSGDTLAKIADRYYHNPSDWQYLYHVNDKTLSAPDVIHAGQRLLIPATVPAHYTLPSYVPKHAKTAQPAAPAVSGTGQQSSGSAATSGAVHGTAAVQPAVVARTTAAGTYSCSGLEQLWEQAGGNPGSAVMAAEIAMAESGGNPNAISPTNDFGLWQINGSNGALATLNPLQNAKSAITLSGNGTNWGPWTTYHSGAYAGKC